MKTLHTINPVPTWPIWIRDGEHCPDPGCVTDIAETHHECLQRFAGLLPWRMAPTNAIWCECPRCWTSSPKHYFLQDSGDPYTCPDCETAPCPRPPR